MNVTETLFLFLLHRNWFFSFPKKSKNFNPNCLHPIIQHDKVAVPLLFMSNSFLEVLNVHNSLRGALKAKAVYIYYQCTHIVISSPVYYCRFLIACWYYLGLLTKCFPSSVSTCYIAFVVFVLFNFLLQNEHAWMCLVWCANISSFQRCLM